MKVLGWILFLSVSSAYAQEVIESTPLSVEDDGARKIVEGQPKAVVAEEPKEIIKVEAVEVKPESLEAVDVSTKKDVKKEKSAEKKKAKKVIAEKPVEPAPSIVVTPVAVEAKTNPQDGQLTLESKENVKVEVKGNEVKIEDTVIAKAKPATLEAAPAPEQKIDIVAVAYYESALKKYLQFSFGYLNSRYEKIHPSLDNGSQLTSFKFVADVSQKLQSGFAVEILNDTSAQTIPDNIRVLQYRLFLDYHSPLYARNSFGLDWVTGLSLSIGDFGIRRRYLNVQGQEVSVKLKDGTIFGLIPAAGIRFYLVGKNSFDLMVEYHQYFGNPQKYIGGLAFAPRINLEF